MRQEQKGLAMTESIKPPDSDRANRLKSFQSKVSRSNKTIRAKGVAGKNSAAKTNAYVVKDKLGGWDVKLGKQVKQGAATLHFDTRAEAITSAEEIVRESGRGIRIQGSRSGSGWEVTREEAIAAARARVIADEIRGARTDARIVRLSKLETGKR